MEIQKYRKIGVLITSATLGNFIKMIKVVRHLYWNNDFFFQLLVKKGLTKTKVLKNRSQY